MHSGVVAVIGVVLLCLNNGLSSPTVTLQGCGPDEMAMQSKIRNLCLYYNGLLKQGGYDNFKSEIPLNHFLDAENSQPEIMFFPAGEPHYINGGVKRQDVDHVFLRFGRRR